VQPPAPPEGPLQVRHVRNSVKVLLDLLTGEFLGSYATKPIYVFGRPGLGFLLLAALTGAVMVWQKLEAACP